MLERHRARLVVLEERAGAADGDALAVEFDDEGVLDREPAVRGIDEALADVDDAPPELPRLAVVVDGAGVDAESLAETAREQALDVDADAAPDLRALALPAGPTGARVAGPDFDPLYANSSGYGYAWFRDDAEITRYLLAVDRERDLALDDWHHRSAALYCDTRLADGSWPHRV